MRCWIWAPARDVFWGSVIGRVPAHETSCPSTWNLKRVVYIVHGMGALHNIPRRTMRTPVPLVACAGRISFWFVAVPTSRTMRIVTRFGRTRATHLFIDVGRVVFFFGIY